MITRKFKTGTLWALASLMIGINAFGCIPARARLVAAAPADGDTAGPVIETADITVPYGTRLRPDDIASISDDRDKAPVLTVTSVEKVGDTASAADSEFEHPAATGSGQNSAADKSADAAKTAAAATTATAATAAAATATTAETAEELEEAPLFFSEPGQYKVVLTGTDSAGNQSQKTITVTAVDNTSPVLNGLRESFTITAKAVKVSNILDGVSAADEIDGDLTSLIKADDSKVKYGTAGTYTVTYSVADAAGNTAKADTSVIIKDMPTGWITTDGQKYYYDIEDGHLYRSWSVVDNKVYYFDPDDGHMLTGLQTIDDMQYLLSEKGGHRITGWQTIDGKRYYFSTDDGHMYHDWSHIDNKLYYFDPDDGHMLTGLQTIEDRQFLLSKKDGHMVTGWQTINSKKYFFSLEDGHMYHDWSKIDGVQYYFDSEKGYMYTGVHKIDGVKYDFGTDGVARKAGR